VLLWFEQVYEGGLKSIGTLSLKIIHDFQRKKHQTRFTSMDDRVYYLYAKGMTTREITATFKEMYDDEYGT